MKTRGNLALAEDNVEVAKTVPDSPRPLLMNFLEKLPGKVIKSSVASDDPTYMGSTGGSEDMDYESD